MSNLADKRYFKSGNSNASTRPNAVRNLEPFVNSNSRVETGHVGNMSDQSGFGEMLPRKSSVHFQMNQLLKVPNFDSLPVKKATVKSIRSPRRVQTGRVKNDLRLTQQPKMSLIPRPSFINSRKSLHGSRSTQLNARKELIKKMVFLAECALKENKEIKQSTPVKMLAGLTPKKTPRSGGYFILPEFQKKVQKLENIRSPIEDLIKKEMFSYSAKPTPLCATQTQKQCNSVKPEPDNKLNLEPLDDMQPEGGTRFTALLHQCKVYNAEVNNIHEKLKALDNSFENKLKAIPDYRVYNEFCCYQLKKEEIYREIQEVEEDLKNFAATQTNIGQKLQIYLKKKREFFEKQTNLHRDFEKAVNAALEKGSHDAGEKKVEKAIKKEETPRLRRSLRLSKMKKSKFEEKTPMTKKLKKLDSKSKGILKSGKI